MYLYTNPNIYRDVAHYKEDRFYMVPHLLLPVALVSSSTFIRKDLNCVNSSYNGKMLPIQSQTDSFFHE